jgi:hypothetical protein
MSWGDLRLVRSRDAAGVLVVRFGVALLDAYLEFLAVRSRPNTVVAVGYDLKGAVALRDRETGSAQLGQCQIAWASSVNAAATRSVGGTSTAGS